MFTRAAGSQTWCIAEVTGVTFFDSAPVPNKVTPAPAPELIGSLHSDSCLHSETLKVVYFATWGKITAWTILPLANMDEYCHAFSAGKQVVVSCLCWSTAGFP